VVHAGASGSPCAWVSAWYIVWSMIQTLGDVLVLVTIISVGVVSFLLAVLLYHLVFVIMDVRQVMKRVNDVTAQLEEMLLKPVEAASIAMGWLQKMVWDMVIDETPKKKPAAKKKTSKKKEKRKRPKKGKKKEFAKKKV
jgi:low affinity Fe/Cu permease